MRRGGPLKRTTPLARGTSEMKRTRLKPRSRKKILADAEATLAVQQHGLEFHRAIRGLRCVVCGRTDSEAFKATGYGHQAHHVLRQEVLKRLGRLDLLWDPDAAVCACEEPCHRQHTCRVKRIPLEALPARARRWAARHGLLNELAREYPR